LNAGPNLIEPNPKIQANGFYIPFPLFQVIFSLTLLTHIFLIFGIISLTDTNFIRNIAWSRRQGQSPKKTYFSYFWHYIIN